MKLAVDVVLLPPEEVMDIVLGVNKRAVIRGDTTIELNKTERIPHLSLLMGVLNSNDLSKVIQLLTEIVKQFQPLQLTIDSIKDQCFGVGFQDQLQKLHETIVTKIDPFFEHQATKDMYLESEGYQFKKDIEYWVNEFVNKHSLDNFWPHITFHSPEKKPVELPLHFVTSRLALCQLGARNTCRKILFETTLNTH
jgi:hypothetical protein